MTATDLTGAVDAWEQVHNLYERYCRSWKVRPDIRVTANGPDRCVVLSVDGAHRNGNVGTMRELAQVLQAAADFVETVNPVWATHPQVVHPPTHFEEKADG